MDWLDTLSAVVRGVAALAFGFIAITCLLRARSASKRGDNREMREWYGLSLLSIIVVLLA